MDALLARIGRSRALPYRLRLELVKQLRPRGCTAAFETASFGAGFEGLRYRGEAGNLIDGQIFYLGMYEPSTLAFLQQAARRIPALAARTFLDVGANTGLFTLPGARLFASVYAFEPYPPIFARLEQHVALNRLGNVRLFRFGLGSAEKDLPFKPPLKGNDAVGTFFALDHEAGAMSLRVRKGDDVLQETPATIGAMKIDVEGFEPEVLAGLKQTLHRDRPVIIMELTRLTKSAFGDRAKLIASLPPRYAIRAVRRKTQDCVLLPFDWAEKQENIVAAPEELVQSLVTA